MITENQKTNIVNSIKLSAKLLVVAGVACSALLVYLSIIYTIQFLLCIPVVLFVTGYLAFVKNKKAKDEDNLHFFKVKCIEHSITGYRKQYNTYFFEICDTQSVLPNTDSPKTSQVKIKSLFGKTRNTIELNSETNFSLTFSSKKFQKNQFYIMCFHYDANIPCDSTYHTINNLMHSKQIS